MAMCRTASAVSSGREGKQINLYICIRSYRHLSLSIYVYRHHRVIYSTHSVSVAMALCCTASAVISGKEGSHMYLYVLTLSLSLFRSLSLHIYTYSG